MMQHPLITVLMPVYNAEKYLREAIDSILQQSFSQFEFLIIDDGSTDASITIIKSYSDNRIRLIENKKNSGISATLNKGIRLASAELIARMDADDISYPHRLQKQFDFFASNKDCVFLSSWAQVITEDKVPVRTEKYDKRFYYYNMTFSCWIYHPTIVFKKDVVMDVGCYQTMYAEDYDLFWRVLRKYKIHHLEETLLDYRVTPQSLHQVTKKKEYDDAMTDQILRNIQFYIGNSVSLTNEEVQCLRFDFDPLIRKRNMRLILGAFRKLKLITIGILSTPNPNLNESDIQNAAYYRKRYIKRFFMKNLSWSDALRLKIGLLFT